MLKDLFPAAYPRYLTLPIFGPMLDDFAGWLLTQGYHHATRRKHITRMVGVDAYLQRHGHHALKTLTLEDVQACWQWYNRHHVHAASTVRVLQQYLAAHGCLPAPRPQPCSPSQAYLEHYTHYLQSVRGFAPLTITQHRCTVTSPAGAPGNASTPHCGSPTSQPPRLNSFSPASDHGCAARRCNMWWPTSAAFSAFSR